MAKILFFASEDWYFISHRLALAEEAIQRGHSVTLVTRTSRFRSALESANIKVVHLSMNRKGLNPFQLLSESLAMAKILLRERPDLVHLVALRPIVVGGIAAKVCGISKVIFAVTGMGFLFADENRKPWVRRLLARLLPMIMSRGNIIVQNAEDANDLRRMGIPSSRLHLIAGAGVNVTKFSPVPNSNTRPVVMLAARLLWDKGVGEFVEAAHLLRHQSARFVLVGMLDAYNPAAIPEEKVNQWVREGIVEWWGHSEDMSETLSHADIFCLPSYREGLPKALLEAMAMGLPCVSTNVPGCRDVVQDGKSGILVPAKDSSALANAIASLINDTARRTTMGLAGRMRTMEEFDQSRIVMKTFQLYSDTLQL